MSADIREYVPKLDLIHVQADEIRVKVAWMGFAMVVSTRLWLCEVVGRTRDTRLADPMQQQFQASSHAACGLLQLTIMLPIFYTVISIYIHFEYKDQGHIVDFLRKRSVEEVHVGSILPILVKVELSPLHASRAMQTLLAISILCKPIYHCRA